MSRSTKPSGKLELYAVNFGEALSVDLYSDDGTFNPDALDQLNHFWRCKRTGTEKAIDPRLYEMLSRIYDHFGKRIELVSGFRNQKRTSSFHFHGSASDIRIPGIADKVLHKFVESLDTGGMGIGIYPRAGSSTSTSAPSRRIGGSTTRRLARATWATRIARRSRSRIRSRA